MGVERAKMLSSEIGVATFRDLLYYFPFRHIDRNTVLHHLRTFRRRTSLSPDQRLVYQLQCRRGRGKKKTRRHFQRRQKMMECVWFSKLQYFSTAYKIGATYVIFGKPGFFRNVYSMVHPEVEPFDPAKPPTGFRGVYSITETMRKRGASTRLCRRSSAISSPTPAFPLSATISRRRSSAIIA